MKSGIGHLVRRWARSLSKRPPLEKDREWVRSQLLLGEWSLWGRMSPADQRHSIMVANRLTALRSEAGRDEIAAALLHDIGKIVADIGTTKRVLATIFGPRTERWRKYLAHEELGLDLCRAAGSTELTLAILADPAHPMARHLRAADEI